MPGRDIQTRCPKLRPRDVELEEAGGDGDFEVDGESKVDGGSKVVSDETDHRRRDGEDAMLLLPGTAMGATTRSVVTLYSFDLVTLKSK